mmetsp:Transcript_70389/g.159240  ORF Transcript_70389/g.159240 Transcript_70389/m.159240 type:complete len:552 (-) Transcript_70389:140-1795(-)
MEPDPRFAALRTLMSRKSHFGIETGSLNFMDGADFQPDPEIQDGVEAAKVLCVGAGGLGCELLKGLALTGFKDVHVIDLDTIDVTNLNRQFLFRKKDVGEPKATVAAAFVNARVPGVKVTPHFGKLQDYGPEWYREFNLVIAGLDNIEARRWLNQTLCSLVKYESDGSVDMMSVIPLIDGGTEGFKGQARVILPMKTSCFECTMNMFPPAQTKAVCTLENNPRQPSDCAIYVFMKIDDDAPEAAAAGAVFGKNEQVALSLEGGVVETGIVLECETGGIKDQIVATENDAMDLDTAHSSGAVATYSVRVPGGVRTGVPGTALATIRQQWEADFGAGTKVDKDSRAHMMWIHERAAARASLFTIGGLTYEATLGSVKNIIPAVASTNAVIAAACVLEAYKCLTFSGQLCNSYLLFNGQSMNVAGGIDCSTQWFERDPECLHCQDTKQKDVQVPRGGGGLTVRGFVERFVLAPGALDLGTVAGPGASTLPGPREPLVYDSEGGCFYCTTGKLAAMKASNMDQALEDFVEDGEVVTITDATWGKNVKRALRVQYS